VFLSSEELRKLAQLFPGPKTTGPSTPTTIDFHRISTELGLHSNQLRFLKNAAVRMQNITKLRNIYSSN
jgi:hypothetical protein